MCSAVLKTTITRVESTEDNNNSNDSTGNVVNNWFDESQHVVTTAATVELIHDLFITRNPNTVRIIQRRKKKTTETSNGATDPVVTTAAINHLLLTDAKDIDEFNDVNDKYVFEDREKLAKRLSELKIKPKAVRKKKEELALKANVELNIIPKTFEDFMTMFCELDSRLIEDQKSKLLFREETHNREIQFRSHDSYVNAFIPFVIREFWSALKESRKGDKQYEQMVCEKLPENDQFIKCSRIRANSESESKFKFGQMVVLKYETSDESKHAFGIVNEVFTELIHRNDYTNSDSIKEFIDSQSEGNDVFMVEKVIIFCHPFGEELTSVSVMPLICVQKYLLEARVCYELKGNRFAAIFGQILKPIFKIGLTGMAVNLEDRNDLFDIQKDAIQKAYDVCALPQTDFSRFVAINGGPKSGKTEVFRETVLQLLKKADMKVKKLLIINSGNTEIESTIEFLKRNEIKVYHIESNGVCLSHKKSDIKRVIRKMYKEMGFDDIANRDEMKDSYANVIKYYNEDMPIEGLSVKDRHIKELIDIRVARRLVMNCPVIIGSICDIANDEVFNDVFNKSGDGIIDCALIDSAHLLTETELLTLLYAGVKGFALFGDSLANAKSNEKCESFFQRYVRLFNQEFHRFGVSKEYSVFHFRDNIASLQRLSKNRQNDRNFKPNRKDRNFTEYRNRSTFGSEFFKRNPNRFGDTKPVFKNETKNEYKPFNNSFRGRGGNNRGSNRPPHHSTAMNRYNSADRFDQIMAQNVDQNPNQNPNPMTDGIVGQMPAYGSRYSYDGRPSHQQDYSHSEYYYTQNHSQ